VTAPPSAVTGGELPRTGPTRTSVVLTLAAMLGALGFGFLIAGPLYARLRR
jgi:LPXTG-motif cell wall-anchored protein